MNPILGALGAGYTAKEIINFLTKLFPGFGGKISQAISSGYGIDEIIKYLQNFKREDFGKIAKKGNKTNNYQLPDDEKEPQTSMQKAYKIWYGDQEEFVPEQKQSILSALGNAAIGAAGLGSGLYALHKGAPDVLEGALKRALPSSLVPLLDRNKTQEPQQLLSQQPPNSNIPIVPQSQEITQVTNAQRDPSKNIALAKNIGEDKRIKNLIEGGMKLEDIAGTLRKLIGKDKIQALEAAEGGLEGLIEDVAKQPKETTEILPKTNESIVNQEKPSISKNETVASPQGIGEIKEIRNGKALVEVNGKKHVIDEDELIQSPLPEKELADLFDDLISGIEKTTGKQVSKNVEWGGYDPKTNELAYKPHGSDKMWVYDDISPEDVELLTSLLTQRKSTGENFIGPWVAGTESPIGAAMSKLIKKLQTERGGKGNEYKNRYETIYDALEPAKKAAKERYAKRKKEAKKPRID